MKRSLPLAAALALAAVPALSSAALASAASHALAPSSPLPAAGTSLPAAGAAGVCPKPTRLTFKRTIGKTTGVLRWRAPKHAARFRVLRNGRVVAQTQRRALRIAVRLDRAYRFTVIPLSAAGQPARCAVTTRRIRIAYRDPGAPRNLVVSGDESGLRLSWNRGAPGDGTLSGYRLLRSGTTIGQTPRTEWELGAAPNRAYRFAVVAVDSRGRTSEPSNTVTAVTGHAPPAPPRGVQALSVSESAIGAQWQPSSVANGQITGYRVLRDGVVVRQVAGTSHVLDNLAPSTSYSVSIVAIDSLGYVSAPSAPVTARTQDPVPTTGHAHAYVLASTDQSFIDFRAHYRQISTIYPTYYDCRGNAIERVGEDDPLVTQWAQARRVAVLPRINCQGTAKVHRLLTDATIRNRWLDDLPALVDAQGYDGLSLDIEAGPASDRDALSSFAETLAARLHARGKLLSMAASPKTSESFTHPRSGIFDYARLAQAVDHVIVMVWGLHWATSAPGAQDDVAWARGVADYVATMPSPHKFIYGTNLYAMDWPAGGGPAHEAEAYEYDDIVPRFPALGATSWLDPVADGLHATYTDASSVGHDVWYPDAATTGRRVRIAADRGFGGVGFWRLGREDQRVWADPLLAPGVPW